MGEVVVEAARISVPRKVLEAFQREGIHYRDERKLCVVCGWGKEVVFPPFPFVLFQRDGSRKKRKQLEQKETFVNIMIHAINVLWAGRSYLDAWDGWIHWCCLPPNMLSMIRLIARKDNKLWMLPACGASFHFLVQEADCAYEEEQANRLLGSDEVDAEKVALPKDMGRIIPFLDLLPDEWKLFYSSGNNLIKNDEEAWTKAAKFKLKPRMSPQQYGAILKRMEKEGMIAWYAKDQVRVVNGIQCVSKSNGKQRLIFDGRPVNCVLHEPANVDLPHFDLLHGWTVPHDHLIVAGKVDIENYYHRLGVPLWMEAFLAMPGILPRWVGKEGHHLLFPVCKTLPMGLSHSVHVAQLVHLQMLRQHSCYNVINKPVCCDQVSWVLVYIDDGIFSCHGENILESKDKVRGWVQEAIDIYRKWGFQVDEDKTVWAEEEVTALGFTIQGNRRMLLPKHEKLVKLIKATRFLLSLSLVRKKLIERILGSWVWFCLLRRPFFSIFFHVYRFLQSIDDATAEVFPLWESVRHEFHLCILLAPWIVMYWDFPWSPRVIASDASMRGGGACHTQFPLMERFTFPLSDLMVPSYTWVSESSWDTLWTQQWRLHEHINVLEARAVVSGLLASLSLSEPRSRVTFLVDSQVVVWACRKGRSSKYRLLCQLRRLASLCCAFDLHFFFWWIPTHLNPADVLSRVFPGE